MNCNCADEDYNTSNTEIRHKHRASVEKKQLTTRLSRIEGQVRGIKAMVDEDRYCVDIITQVLAVQSALNGFNKELLSRHIETCVKDDIKNDDENAVEELCSLIRKIMK